MVIHYYKPYITNSEIRAAKRVLKSGKLSQGIEVEKLEENYRKYTKCKYAIALCNATAGLFLSAMAIKDKYTSLYIDNITFIADYQAGMTATKLNDNINLFAIYKDFSTPFEVKCVPPSNKKYGILTHLGGKVLNTWYDKTIHDCSHLFPVEITDKNAIAFVYSLHGSKIIGIGEGGVVCTNNKYVYAFIKSARQHGRDKIGYEYKYTDNIANGNYKLSDLQAAVANSLIDRKDELLFDRENIARFYCDKLGIEFDNNHQYHLFQYPCETIGKAKKIEKVLKENRIAFSKHFIPIDRVLNMKHQNKTDYERYLKTISLPIYKGLTLIKLNDIVSVVRSVK